MQDCMVPGKATVIKGTKTIQLVFLSYYFDLLFYLLYLRAKMIPYYMRTSTLAKVYLVLDYIHHTEVKILVVIQYLDLNRDTLQLLRSRHFKTFTYHSSYFLNSELSSHLFRHFSHFCVTVETDK